MFKKMCLILITSDLTWGFGDRGMHIVEPSEKAYVRYS